MYIYMSCNSTNTSKKPPNLLLQFTQDSELPHILMSDFGESEVLSAQKQQERTGATGTLEFMPPELLEKDSQGRYREEHSLKADIWSLGVVLYFLCLLNSCLQKE